MFNRSCYIPHPAFLTGISSNVPLGAHREVPYLLYVAKRNSHTYAPHLMFLKKITNPVPSGAHREVPKLRSRGEQSYACSSHYVPPPKVLKT